MRLKRKMEEDKKALEKSNKKAKKEKKCLKEVFQQGLTSAKLNSCFTL